MRLIKILSILLLFTGSLFSQKKVEWPEITQQNKPWTRWWWMGSAVNKTDLTRSMELYQKAGLGGMEITAIYGVRGEEDKFINYLSPKWCDMFQHTLNEAGRLDLGIDLANASGWPFGGPWVTPEDACKTLELNTYELSGGQKLKKPLEFTQKPLIRIAGPYKPSWNELKDPINKTPELQYKALDQVRFKKKIPLVAVMAFSNNGETINLMSNVESDGTLNWIAPSGDWTIYALFQGWHGKMVERAGPGGEGDVIDHFSLKATDKYLSYFDNRFKDMDLSNLRGYFNDSYEVDDARGEANWTPNFFNEFQTRRGYDLREFIPALYGKMRADTSELIYCDYRETISDLLLDNYTKEWHKWASKQDKIIRNQAHGSPANILDLYAATDIPEVEGEHIPSIKLASSAAHVTGKKLTSSESATWLNQHFKSTLSDAKHALDLLMLGGINHIFYHGTCYSPKDAEWPGWLFYAAVHFNPNNTFWGDFSALNKYVAHCQSFLQEGQPDNDVLLYYPIYDLWSKPGRSKLVHINGYRGLPENWGTKLLAEEMVEKGYSYDYISDKQILDLSNNKNHLVTSNINYQTIIVPNTRYIPAKTLQKLISLAGNGATVLIQGSIPKLSGFGNLQQKRDQRKSLLEDLQFIDNKKDSTTVANFGYGKIIIGSNLQQLMNAAKVKRETMTDNHIQCVRRKINNDHFYFITNHGEKSFDQIVTLSHSFKYAALLNPMTGEKGVLNNITTTDEGTKLFLSLKPGETTLLLGSDAPFKGDSWNFYSKGDDSKEIKGSWNISFIKGGPTLPKAIKTKDLQSWTDFIGEEYQIFSGTAKYEIEFKNPGLNGNMIELDLGEVFNTAKVYLNKNLIATLIGPEYKVTIDATMLQQKNSLVVEVSNSMENRIAYLDKQGVEWRKFYNTNFQTRVATDRGKDGWFTAINWNPQPSGLVGPVKLSELIIKE